MVLLLPSAPRPETNPDNKSDNISNIINYCKCKSKPDFYVEVALREVYVTAKNKEDRHITDLKPEEFKLWVDDKPQDILAVDKVNLKGKDYLALKTDLQTDEASMPAAPSRYFTLLIANLPERKTEREIALTGILEFVKGTIQPTDYASLYVLTPSEMKLLVPFDIHREKSLSEIIKLLESEDAGSRGFSPTRRGRIDWTNDEDDVKNMEFLNICNSLTSLCNSLRFISGKKNLIIFSEGFYFYPNWGKELDTANDETKTKHNIPPNILMKRLLDLRKTFVSYDIELHVMDMGKRSNLIGDINERTAVDNTIEREEARTTVLKTIAGATGGRFYSFTDTAQKIDDRMKSVEYDTSFYYMLSYIPSERADPNSFVPLKIEVARQDVSLNYKKATVEPKEMEDLNKAEQDAQISYMSQSSILYNMITMCAGIVILPGYGKESEVVVGVQMPLEEIIINNKNKNRGELDVCIYAFNGNNEIVQTVNRILNMNFKKESEGRRKSHLALYYSMLLAPSDYRIRIFLRNRDNLKISSEEFNITVPDYAAPAVSIGSLMLYSEMSEVISANLNKTLKTSDKEKDVQKQPAFAELPGLYSISNEIKNYRRIAIGVPLKGISKNDLKSRFYDLLKCQAVKTTNQKNQVLNPVDIGFRLSDIFERTDGILVALFELEMMDLPDGEYQVTMRLQPGGGVSSSSSIKLNLL